MPHASSAYLYISSFDGQLALAAAGGAMFQSVLQPRQFWINPTMCGTVGSFGFFAVSTGTPAAKLVKVEIWRVKSGGNPFLAITSNDYDLLSAGDIDPTSIPAGTAVTSNFWLTVPMTPFYLDDTFYPQNDTLSRFAGYGYGVGVKLFRTAANSDNGANDAIGIVLSNSLDPQQGSYINSGFAHHGGGAGGIAVAFDYVDPCLYLLGSLRTSSLFLDLPNSKQSFVHSVIAFQAIGAPGAANSRRALKFTAVGSAITRTAWAVRWDNNVYKGVYGGIYTHNVNSDLPDTCIGTSQLITVAVGGNLFTGDFQQGQLPAMFIFENGSGVTVASGTPYWMTFENASGSDVGIELTQYLQQGQRRASWNNSFVAADSQGWQAYWWYRDADTSSAAAVAPPGNIAAGYVYRSYPIGSYRSYPIGTFRSKPKG